MQTTSVALYQQLVPGISNVTLRMRYYGLYAWLAQTYAKRVGDTSTEEWCLYLRRAEALYALVAVHNGGERGVAGVDWANRTLAAATGNRVVFHPGTDRGEGEPQYLKQKFGAFGAAYGSQLDEIGLLEYVKVHDVPVPTVQRGEAIAQAFASAIGEAAEVFLAAANHGSVRKSDLERLAVMLPSRIAKSSRERNLYQDLLFGGSHTHSPSAAARNLSLRLVLRVAQSKGRLVGANDVRWALYGWRNDAGEELAALPNDEDAHKFSWAVYQANDLLHVCYETIMKFALDVLGTSPTGMVPERLVERVVSRLCGALEERNVDTWTDLLASIELADNPRSVEDELSEFSLQRVAFTGADAAAMSNEETAAAAILLLAVLHKRFGSLLDKISLQLPVVSEAAFLQSIVTELKFLQEHTDVPLQELVTRIIRQRILDRHQWVAINKFQRQGDYTFLLELDEGRVRVRQKDGPVFTNPRLSPAIGFLQDIHLLNESGPTAAGMRLLEAA